MRESWEPGSISARRKLTGSEPVSLRGAGALGQAHAASAARTASGDALMTFKYARRALSGRRKRPRSRSRKRATLISYAVANCAWLRPAARRAAFARRAAATFSSSTSESGGLSGSDAALASIACGVIASRRAAASGVSRAGRCGSSRNSAMAKALPCIRAPCRHQADRAGPDRVRDREKPPFDHADGLATRRAVFGP